MLYLVGLGLGDAKDITVKGLEIVKRADYVFLEAYTSILCVGQEALVCKVQKNIKCSVTDLNMTKRTIKAYVEGRLFEWLSMIYPMDFVYLPTLSNSMMCHLAPQSLTSCFISAT